VLGGHRKKRGNFKWIKGSVRGHRKKRENFKNIKRSFRETQQK
jgi:hypothetical protein